MKKLGRILEILLAVVLLFSGIYGIYKVVSNNDTNKSIKSVMINETISDKSGVNFCVTKVDNLKSVGSGIKKVTTENNFIVLYVKITNKSNEPYDVNTLRFLLTEGENEYQYSSDALFSFDNYMYMDQINPNLSKEYVIVYETLNTSEEKDFVLKIKSNVFNNKDNVYIVLKEHKNKFEEFTPSNSEFVTPTLDVSSSTERPLETPRLKTSYQSILDEYSKKIKDAVPVLIEEYNEEAAQNNEGLSGLAKLCNNKISELAKICNEGVGEMAEYMYKYSSGSYSEYSEWSGKLYDVYIEEAGKITDAYLKSAQ